MRSSLRRILTVFYKDIKENTVVILVLMVIPLMVFYLPALFPQGGIRVCVVAPENQRPRIALEDKSLVHEGKQEAAMKLLEDKKVDAVVNVEEKTVYTYSRDPRVLGGLRTALASQEKPLTNINISNGQSSSKNYTALLCSLLILMIGLIGSPIVFMSESRNDVISSLMLSPLSHTEFIISKALFSFASSMGAIMVFLAVTGGIGANPLRLLVMVIVSALFMTMVSALISLPFKSVEQTMVLTSPLTLLAVLAEVLLYGSGNTSFLPIQAGFRHILLTDKLPAGQIAILLSASMVLFGAYVFMYRWVKRMKTVGSI